MKFLAAQAPGADMNGLRDLGRPAQGQAGRLRDRAGVRYRRQGEPHGDSHGGRHQGGSPCRQPDQSHRVLRGRRRRRPSEHGPGRRQEPGRHRRGPCQGEGSAGKPALKRKKIIDVPEKCAIIYGSAIKIPDQSYDAQYRAGGEVRCETMSNVIVKENETLDSALRRFKRSCAKAGIQQEIRKREHYEKPSVRRKKKSEAARKRKYN